MRRVVIVGAGGLGREAAWMIGRINAVTPHFELLGFCDDAEEKREGLCDTIPLLGTLDQVTARFGPVGFFCAIGNNHTRREVTRYARSAGHEPVTLVDPSAVIAPDAVIGVGSYVGIRSVVSVGVRLGEGVLVNHQVCVGHDVRVGDFAQLCPGVCVSGGCELGEGALLGTLSGTIPLRRVGAWATVGAGTMAFRDVAEGQSVVRLIATT